MNDDTKVYITYKGSIILDRWNNESGKTDRTIKQKKIRNVQE